MSSSNFHRHILELIRRTSAYLPPDVSDVIETHRALEQRGSKADLALELVSQNIGLAKRLSAPIARITGPLPSTARRQSGLISWNCRTSSAAAWQRRPAGATCGRTPARTSPAGITGT